MKLLHTSDWHIGRIFYNVSLLQDQVFALDALVEIIKQHEIDVVIIAGDIYDRSVPPAAAVEVLDGWLNEVVSELGVPVFMISGNHDSAKRLSFGSRQLKASGLTIVGNFDDMLSPAMFEKGDVRVQVSGVPYCDPEHVRDAYQCDVRDYDHAHEILVDKVKQSLSPNIPSVVVSHCFIDGAAESESERALNVGGADRVSYNHFESFDYVALGHLHQPQYKGYQHIRYSGSLLKYSFSEQHHNKGATIVTFNESGVSDISHVTIPSRLDMRVVEGSFDQIISNGKCDPKSDDYILARITDKTAILDPMAKIREVYPNAMHLERPLLNKPVNDGLDRDVLKRSEAEVFADFFSQMKGGAMTDEQVDAIAQVVTEALKGGQE